jgi:hypothetical protein
MSCSVVDNRREKGGKKKEKKGQVHFPMFRVASVAGRAVGR